MKRFIDKIQALWVLLIAKEYVVYTCNNFITKKGANCWISYGIENKETFYDIFLESTIDHSRTLI